MSACEGGGLSDAPGDVKVDVMRRTIMESIRKQQEANKSERRITLEDMILREL